LRKYYSREIQGAAAVPEMFGDQDQGHDTNTK
jgi:hypothetical protein